MSLAKSTQSVPLEWSIASLSKSCKLENCLYYYYFYQIAQHINTPRPQLSEANLALFCGRVFFLTVLFDCCCLSCCSCSSGWAYCWSSEVRRQELTTWSGQVQIEQPIGKHLSRLTIKRGKFKSHYQNICLQFVPKCCPCSIGLSIKSFGSPITNTPLWVQHYPSRLKWGRPRVIGVRFSSTTTR